MSLYKGSCHCGKVDFQVQGEFTEGLECNCSICHKKGSTLGFTSKENFSLNSSMSSLSDYQFGKKNIHHYFCSTCGIAPFGFGKSKSGQEMVSINLRCLNDLDFDDLKIKKFDGKSL